jgi:hypothetical protein
MRLTDEQVRRDWFQFRPDGCWCAGCVGMGPCDDDAGHGDTWVDELADEDVADDDAGYPWPTGTIIEHAFAERGLL